VSGVYLVVLSFHNYTTLLTLNRLKTSSTDSRPNLLLTVHPIL